MDGVRTHADVVPGKRPGEPDQHSAAQTGQILIMFALFATAMLGMLGLATDLGYAFANRRNSQNAADAGALAGASAVLRQEVAWTPVSTTVAQNVLPGTSLSVTECSYVTDAGPHTSVGACTGSPPPTATGVHVHVAESHGTLFMRLFGITSASTTAEATANVQILANPPLDGPFLVCGVRTKVAGNGNNTFNLLTRVNGEWIFNKEADGRWFEIYGPRVEDCDAKAERYKGAADQAANAGKKTPDWFQYKEGDATGLVVKQDVQGPGGCKAGTLPTNCVIILPIAVNDPPESDNNRGMYTVGWAAFYLVAGSPSENRYYGKFLYSYSVKGGGKPGWKPGSVGGVTTIRLTQ